MKYLVTLSSNLGSIYSQEEFNTYHECLDYAKKQYGLFWQGASMWVNIWNNELGRTIRDSKLRQDKVRLTL